MVAVAVAVVVVVVASDGHANLQVFRIDPK